MKILTELKDLGYSIILEGENIRLRYLGMGAQPAEAQELIEALKARKAEAVEHLRQTQPLPYFDHDNGVVIPFDCDPRFHYWRLGGQSLAETEEDLREWRH